MSPTRPWSLMSVYAGAVVVAGVIGRGSVMIAGLHWNGAAAWIGTLIGMVVGGLAAARFFASRLDSAADAAAALARAQTPPPSETPSPLEFARLNAELHAAAALQRDNATALRELRHEQDALMDAVEGAVIALDKEQRIINLNRAAERMLAMPPRESGTPAPAVRPARGLLLQEIARFDALNRFVSDAIASAAPLSEEFQLAQPMKEGGRIGFSVRASSRPLFDSQGRTTAVLVFLTDVTRLRRLEAVRTDFAANVSHELRTPITNIRGYVDTLVDSPLTDPESTREFLKIVHRNAVRLSDIVDDMLALTNLERPDNAESLATAPTPLIEIINPVLEAVGRQREERNAVIDVEGDTGLRAAVNPRLVDQALQNLVSNAIRYSPPGKRVVIRASTSQLPGDGAVPRPAVELAVIDEGPGIAAEHLPRVFERFYRVDKARGRDQGGTGLGLSIVKHIALAHHGKVSVESTPGQGSTFRLTLPAA
jgi:two-component system phosphate regulon sensor histidine kinase PhoR